MAIIDNTLAAQTPVFNPATPLMQAAKIQEAQVQQQQEQFKLRQAEVGSEARGLVPFVNTPEFPARWAETADRLAQKGLIDPQTHQKWRNAPSPLLLKQMIAQTEDPTLAFRKERAGVEDKQWAAGHSLRVQAAKNAADPTPDGFEKKADGTYAPLPGGPQDPSYLARVSSAEGKKNVPPGFEPTAEGGLRPIPGGPADPAYLRTKGDRQNAPSGYQWNDPNNPSAGMTPIPGGPAEKVDAEVAGRLGLAKSFLGQLNDYTDAEGNPQTGLRARIKAGEATGPIDGAMAAANLGEQGSIHRKVSSGAEALLRMLTGAGMNIEEAKKYVKRYEPQWNDSSTTLLDKVNQLDRELNSVGETVGKGRGGWNPGGDKPKDKPPAAERFQKLMIENGGDKAKAYKKLAEEGY